jgi:hypothetical protein
METKSIRATARPAVRWPFRILAAFVLAVGVVATVGMAWSIGHHEMAAMRWQFLAGLPGFAWLLRQTWHAAVHGQSAKPEYWPFASQRVFNGYVVVWMVLTLTAAG